MTSAPLPPNEEFRLNDLLKYNILDTAFEDDYQDLAILAAEICNCPIAVISFIDSDRQWIKSANIRTISETKRDDAICAYTILKEEVMVIKDVTKDERFLNNEFNTEQFSIGFYAGAPIISINGFALGAICVIDKDAKHIFSESKRNALKIIAKQISKLLELRLQYKLMIENTALLLEYEKKITQLTLINHDNEKSFIANELHENFAQTLTGIKFFIESAEQSNDNRQEFLKKSKENISDLIKQLKVFTKLMLPTTIEYDNYVEVINELIIEFGKNNDVKIKLTFNNKFKFLEAKMGLTMFRIMENHLNIAKESRAKNICIIIEKTIDIFIQISHDGNPATGNKEAKDLLLRNTITRVDILKGRLIELKYEKDQNVLEIHIPIAKGE